MGNIYVEIFHIWTGRSGADRRKPNVPIPKLNSLHAR